MFCRTHIDQFINIFEHIDVDVDVNQKAQNSSGGSKISSRGASTSLGGADSRGSYVLKILYVETKESGPLGDVRRARPPQDPLMNSDVWNKNDEILQDILDSVFTGSQIITPYNDALPTYLQ